LLEWLHSNWIRLWNSNGSNIIDINWIGGGCQNLLWRCNWSWHLLNTFLNFLNSNIINYFFFFDLTWLTWSYHILILRKSSQVQICQTCLYFSPSKCSHVLDKFRTNLLEIYFVVAFDILSNIWIFSISSTIGLWL